MMKRTLAYGLLPLLAVACSDITEPAPELSAVPQTLVKGDAIYQLSSTGYIVKVKPGPQGETPYTDLEGTTVQVIGVGEGPTGLIEVPGSAKLLTLVHGREGDALAVLEPAKTCTGEVPVDLGCVTWLDAPAVHDQLVVSPDGRYALSWISEQAAANSDSVVINLGEVAIYDLESLETQTAQPGTGIQQVEFSSLSEVPFAVILTGDQVVKLALETGVVTPRDLTLTTATDLKPQQVVLTDDEAFALVTLVGSKDLFTFDLSQSTLPINILSLVATPKVMLGLDATAQTVVLSSAGTQVDVISGTANSVESWALPYPATAVKALPGQAKAVFYDDSGSYPYFHLLDLETRKVQTWLLDQGLSGLDVSPDGGALVLHYGSLYGSGGAVALFNLAEGDREPSPIQLVHPASATLFEDQADPSQDAVFLAMPGGYDPSYVARFNVSSLQAEVVEVPPAPLGLSLLADGRVVVVHASTLGMLSVFPASDPALIQFIPNFAPVAVF